LTPYLEEHSAQVREAADRIRPHVRRTPVLSTDLDPQLRFKPESFQVTGAFKPRGAFNAVLSMLERGERPPGLIAVSSGNHAQGVALAAATVGLPALILIPEGSNPAKVAATRALGAEVIQDGITFVNREERMRELMDELGYVLVHPFDDWDVIHGAGTAVRELLEDLASQAGLVLKNVGLTAELLQRLDDLRASRQRLVAAQDEERRRLERNLHDGAQQNLVAIKVKLGLAEMFAEKDPAKARATLAELKVDTDEALDTLRDLARGIYPPLLADQGLAAALESQARKATVRVEVQADGIGRYAQDIEAAVYFCCLEALQNVQKYAAAQTAVVKLSGSGDALTFEVTDDGHGFDAGSVRRGAGLTNMTDRIDSLGGSLEVLSTPGRGTRIHGSLPVVATAAAVSLPVGAFREAT